jgi:hypothetical protein
VYDHGRSPLMSRTRAATIIVVCSLFLLASVYLLAVERNLYGLLGIGLFGALLLITVLARRGVRTDRRK